MTNSLTIRVLLAAGALSLATPGSAQQAQVGNPAAAAMAAALPAPPAGPQAAGTAQSKPQTTGTASAAQTPPTQEILDPGADAERRKAEELARLKREEERRIKTELLRGCVIKPVMSDAEIARCR